MRTAAGICLGICTTAFATSFAPRPSHDLIFVQVPAAAKPQRVDSAGLRPPTDRYVDGSRIVRLPSSGAEPVVLTPEFAGASDPAVSFDGESVVFAGKQGPNDSWQIWRMQTDGSHKRQITAGPGNKFTPVHAGRRFYLNDPQPTPQIVYSGTVDGSELAIFATDSAGESIRRLTFNLHSDIAPDVLPTGRLVFASWQRYGDRHEPHGLFALTAVNLDGTDFMPFYGNHEMPRSKGMVHVSISSERVYFIESDGSPWLGGGDIAYVSWRRPLNSYNKLSHDPDGVYHSPTSLPGGGLIASYRRGESDAVFGIYNIDPESGERGDSIFEQAGWHSIDATVLAPRPATKGRSNWLIPGASTGVFYCLDAYRTNLDDADLDPGEIKHVRVIEGVPIRAGATVSLSPHGARRLLGIAPVHPDGSFHIRVPAETPITFQLLNEQYMALRTQAAWTWVMGNENRGCIGCHEDRELSPPNAMVDAVIRPAVELTLPPERRRTVDFRNQIAPIIESKCATAGCHATGGVGLDLANSRTTVRDDPFSVAYRQLLNASPQRIVPGSAKDSPLIQRLVDHGSLNDRERILFIEWIDLGAQWDVRNTIRGSQPDTNEN